MSWVDILKIIIPILIALFGAYVKLRERITILETKADILMDNVNGLGRVIGTEKSKGPAVERWRDLPTYLNEKSFSRFLKTNTKQD